MFTISKDNILDDPKLRKTAGAIQFNEEMMGLSLRTSENSAYKLPFERKKKTVLSKLTQKPKSIEVHLTRDQ